MSKNISKRIEQVQSPVIPIVGKMIADHPGTISLGQGVVYYPPPPEVKQSVLEAVEQDSALDRYGDVFGTKRLLDLIRQKLLRENGISLEPGGSVVCTAGSNMGFLNSVLAIGDIGDEIILLSPYYFNHHMALELAGIRPVIVPTTSDYQIDLDAIEVAITPRTRAVVTISPNNPTGAVYPPHALTAVNELCKSRGLFHISDEAYEYFVYDEAMHFSPASLAGALEHTISLYSFSKAFGMAGWRSGFMVVPAQLVDSIRKIQDTNLICPPIVGQAAAAAALEFGSSWCQQRLPKFNDVRDTILAELAELQGRCRIPVPQGAFYLLLQLHTGHKDMMLVERLIKDYGVAVLPGSTFGVERGCALRVSYGALDPETVVTGIGRLKTGLRELL